MQPAAQTAQTPRVLACISASERALPVIRAAIALAREQRAELRVLHIEQPGAATRRPPQETERLDSAVQYAMAMGARVEILAGRRIAQAIMSHAAALGVTLVVVGAPRARGWRRALAEDVVAGLRGAGAPELIVLGESEAAG